MRKLSFVKPDIVYKFRHVSFVTYVKPLTLFLVFIGSPEAMTNIINWSDLHFHNNSLHQGFGRSSNLYRFDLFLEFPIGSNSSCNCHDICKPFRLFDENSFHVENSNRSVAQALGSIMLLYLIDLFSH